MSATSGTLDPIKTKHRALWALGDYDRVSTEVVDGLGPAAVTAAHIRPGERVLDVAAGSGNASLPAAEAGGVVTATDLCPELVEIGRQRSIERGLQITWREADAEHLPCDDAAYDVVISTVGVMFAPFHQPVADQLLRVTRPGGRIVLINWTPAGFIGQLFTAMRPFVPAAPAGATPGPMWGDEQHVRALFGASVRTLTAEKRTLAVDRFATAAEFRRYFAAYYGPTIAAYRNVADDPARTAGLDRAIDEVAHRFGIGTGSGASQWEYLLVVAERA